MLVNPVSFRLSISTFWRSIWTTYNIKNYKYLLFTDLIFFEYFNWFCKKFFTNLIGSCIISHVRFYKTNNKFIINLFYYHSDFNNVLKQLTYFKIRSPKGLNKKRKNNIRFKYKKNNFHKNNSRLIVMQKKKDYANLFKLHRSYKLLLLKRKIILKKILKSRYKTKSNLSNTNWFSIKRLLKKKKTKISALDNYLNNARKKYISNQHQKLNKKKNKLKKYKKRYNYLFYLNQLKLKFCLKYFLYNIYIYFIKQIYVKHTTFLTSILNLKYELNFFCIDLKYITASIINEYLKASLAVNYNLLKSLRPVLLDLNKRIYLGEISGFKIAFSGRFRRTQMATYFWRKNGKLGTGSVIFDIDYNFSILKTKYGVCALKIWLAKEKNLFKNFQRIYPLLNPFFIKNKFVVINNVKILTMHLQLNKIFINYFYKLFFVGYSNLKKNYYINIFKRVLFNYIYLNIFLKNLKIKNKKLSKIFLPHYLNYKLNFFDLIYNLNTIVIIPLLNYKYLQRINTRSSYKLRFFNKLKYKKLKMYKYKIYLN